MNIQLSVSVMYQVLELHVENKTVDQILDSLDLHEDHRKEVELIIGSYEQQMRDVHVHADPE
jgi:hypothetical protein